MSKKGPILLVEDDANDLDLVKSALLENVVKNQILCFTGAAAALHYLATTSDMPFLILCDIRMQGMNGLEFRNEINSNDLLRKKSIPFVFLTAAVSQEIVDEAYDLTVQGFVEKPADYANLRDFLARTIAYWEICVHPNSF